MAFCDDCGTGDHWTKNCPKAKPKKKAEAEKVLQELVEDLPEGGQTEIATAVCVVCGDKALADYLSKKRIAERQRKQEYRERQKK